MATPGFNAEASIYRSETAYRAVFLGTSAHGAASVLPQFRSRVRRQCGRCVGGTRTCFVWGYECTVEEGSPGSPDLGIPPSPGYVRCEPEVFNEFEVSC